MSEIQRQRREIAVSVRKLLAQFHEETQAKLAIAPVDSVTLHHSASGITEVDEDGWCADYDDMTKEDTITVQPVSVVDTVRTTHRYVEHTNQRKDTTDGPQ
ncbi:hypothetical protein OG874_25485 [Nocardia sp. NBC_00565]|uniref:hypothetical protein n=1 Tax=Nocardia sp. NBC_00565 TaxID=2975993 RepID=UPI002E81A732|nr:hypothetical protein [Nocardia sp. NBC_00565]WUC00250.1 hypothetical protein OG874_25485 [Nocardia sp. NBC_00565]